MKILLLADEEEKFLWDYYRPGCLSEYDMILSAGDLKSSYLSFIVTMANRPLLYVHGNHDGSYSKAPPEGCECVEDRIITVGGVRVLGLGGARKYNGGPCQYSEQEMARRIRRLALKLRKSGGVDIVLTHSPPAGYGDAEDNAHKGFEAFLPLLDKYKPSFLVHGHVHKSYGIAFERETEYNGTRIINASGRYTIEI